MKTRVWAACIASTFVFFYAFPTPSYAYELYTVSGFIDLLIEKGLIQSSQAQKAIELAELANKISESTSEKTRYGENAEFVTVRANQLIENGDLSYKAGRNITGLLLIATNISPDAITLEANRGCRTIYSIYNEADKKLYDSGERSACKHHERVTYVLEGGASRLFDITHRVKDYPLEPGTYRFLLDYPGYGSGERVVEIF